MNGRGTLEGRDQDRRDAEITRLKKEVEALRERERAARAEAEAARKHFSELTAMSKRFASSMNTGARERQRYRQRLAAQYAISRVLAEAHDLQEAAPRVFEILGERLGWHLGVLWTLDRQACVLRRSGIWRSSGSSPGAMEEACEDVSLRCGESLPGRVWEREEPVWVEDVIEDEYFLRNRAAAEDGMRGALAFPIREGGFVGVFEFFRREVLPPDENLLRTAGIIGDQIGQFLERRQAEEERERLARQVASERARFEAILQQMPAGVFVAVPSGEFVLSNEEAVRIYGRSIGSLEECSRCTSLYPDGGETSPERSTLGRSLWHGEVVSGVEFYVHRPDGTRSLVSANSAPIRDEEGRIVAAVKAFEDITQRKETEAALKETEAKLMGLFRSDAVGIAWGEEDMMLECNDEALRMIGYTREDLLEGGGLNWVEMTPPEDREKSEQAVQEAIETGKFAPFERNFIRKDGSLVPTIIGGHCLGTNPFRYIAFILDNSDRKRAEAALRESEERYKILYEDNPSMYFTLDGDGTILSVNSFGAEQLGYAAEELRGRPLSDVFHEEDKEGVMRYIRKCLRNPDRIGDWEARKLRKDGSVLWVREHARVARNPQSGTIVLVTCVDITKRKRAEEERERSLSYELQTRAQAEERRRISRELHDRVAHSMGVVHQSLELYEALKERNPEGAKAKMELARKTAKEALASTRNLSMELRRPEIRRGLEAALRDLLHDVVPETIRCTLSVEGDEALVPPHAREQLFLILREAVRNAVAHSDCREISVELEVTPEGMAGAIEDDGRGFDPEEALSSGSNGLRSMQERALLVGGAFDVSSAPDGGTRVEISLPLGVPAEEDVSPAEGALSKEGA